MTSGQGELALLIMFFKRKFSMYIVRIGQALPRPVLDTFDVLAIDLSLPHPVPATKDLSRSIQLPTTRHA